MGNSGGLHQGDRGGGGKRLLRCDYLLFDLCSGIAHADLFTGLWIVMESIAHHLYLHLYKTSWHNFKKYFAFRAKSRPKS
jgi:hypothetical protein